MVAASRIPVKYEPWEKTISKVPRAPGRVADADSELHADLDRIEVLQSAVAKRRREFRTASDAQG